MVLFLSPADQRKPNNERITMTTTIKPIK